MPPELRDPALPQHMRSVWRRTSSFRRFPAIQPVGDGVGPCS
jgi:hypothetical protein